MLSVLALVLLARSEGMSLIHWIRRLLARWAECILVAVALFELVKGVHFPPPVAGSFVVVGLVRNIQRNDALLNFVVGGVAFESGHLDPGFERLSRTLADGEAVKVEGWRSWPPGERAEIASVSIDGASIVSKGSSLSLAWFENFVELAMSAGAAWCLVFALKRPTSLWENHRRRVRERRAR
jgi:hypothetical protein